MKILLKMVFVLLFLALASCVGVNEDKREFEQSRIAMDTYITITLYAQSQSDAQQAFEKAFETIYEIEEIFNIYEEETQASILNVEGKISNASDEFIYLNNRARHYSNITGGHFDITVQPILDLYDESFGTKGRPPTADEIKETLKLVNSSYVEINNRNVSLQKDSMKVTYGSIAKGYAVDKAVEKLRELGINSALVSAGGDMYALGEKEEGNWRVAVNDPGGGYLMNFTLKDEAVVTSGDYERYFDEEGDFHHIVNPKTGYSANKTISATVVAQNATKADPLATGVFAMGPEDGLKLIEELNDTEAMVIDRERNIHTSSGFER
ncbi:MAG: FAD:protein FMN transferase [Candidatus Nanoarchaeia archaeon]